MERFILTEMTLRGTKFVPARGADPVEMGWAGLCERLAPRIEDRGKLRILKPCDLVGVKRYATGLGNFILSNTDRTGNVAWLLKKQPLAFEGLEVVYRVELAQYDQRIVEAAAS